MRSVAAMALVRALAGKSGMEKEADARDAWWVCLLHKGLFFQFEAPGQSPCVFMSLGFHGHAALCWALDVISCPDLGDGCGARAYLQLSKVALQTGRCNQPLPFRWVFGHEVKHLSNFQGLVVELLIPALKPRPGLVPGLGPGLVYQVTAKQDMLPFCFQQKVPLTSQQLVLLAKFLNLRLQRVRQKTAQKEAAMLAAQAVALHVLPDLPPESRDEIVKAIVTGSVADLPATFDPLLCPIIDEIRGRNNVDLPKSIVKALDEQHAAAKGQALQGAAPQVSRERRAAMAKVAHLEKTPREYRDLIPGNGLIPGCRLVQPEGSLFVQGYYPRALGDVRGSRWSTWEDGRRTKAQAVQQVLDWMWARHRRAAAAESAKGLELAPDASDSERGPGCGPGPGRGRALGNQEAPAGRGRQRGRGRGRGRGVAPSEDPQAPAPAGIPAAVTASNAAQQLRGRGRGHGGGPAPANTALGTELPHGGGPAPPYQQVSAAVALQASAHYSCLW